MKFQDWITSQPINQSHKLKARIIERCKLTRHHSGRCFKLENWINQKSKVPALAQERINAIAKQQLTY